MFSDLSATVTGNDNGLRNRQWRSELTEGVVVSRALTVRTAVSKFAGSTLVVSGSAARDHMSLIGQSDDVRSFAASYRD